MAPLIVITGPTASGKSALALDLAERYNGEIICADSRTVYTGMDIGTAKPSTEEQARVPHHLLDVAEPDQRFSLHDFQTQARAAIDDIRRRGKVPFLVGGTGLYVDAVVLDFELGVASDEAEREQLEKLDVNELQRMLREQQISLPRNDMNKRHLIRALEQKGQNTRGKDKPDQNTYVVAIATDRETLDQRIALRAGEMFTGGVIAEARQLAGRYGWDSEAMTGNIYPILREVIEGRMTEQEATEKIIIRDRQLVKRQITWLKRHDYVRWLSLDDARSYLEGVLV
jgi:tRNA dimethylallyltransferase